MLLDNYINKIAIEADLLQEMSRTYVLPAAHESINKLGETYRNLNDMGLKDQAQSIVAQVSPLTDLTIALHNGLSQLMEAKEAADGLSYASEVAQPYADRVKPHFDKIRASIDKLEGQIDDRIWQLPKYRELLFIR